MHLHLFYFIPLFSILFSCSYVSYISYITYICMFIYSYLYIYKQLILFMGIKHTFEYSVSLSTKPSVFFSPAAFLIGLPRKRFDQASSSCSWRISEASSQTEHFSTQHCLLALLHALNCKTLLSNLSPSARTTSLLILSRVAHISMLAF